MKLLNKNIDHKWAPIQLTEKEAIEFALSKKWEKWTPEQIVDLQLFQKNICVPFQVFMKSLSIVLGRPVYTHELFHLDSLKYEYRNQKPSPSIDEIVDFFNKNVKTLNIFPKNNYEK